MSTFRKNQAQRPITGQRRTVMPDILTGEFEFTFEAAPDPSQFVAPGFIPDQGTWDESYWVLFTRAVVSWNIILGQGVGFAPGLGGGSLTVWLGTIQDPDAVGSDLAVWPWRTFTLYGEGTPNIMSGLEIGAADFARFEIRTGDEDVLGVNCYGSVQMRSY